jgi:hypothetical protein
MNPMISSENAKKQAKKFHVPTPGSGEFVKLPSIEVLHHYLIINNLEVVRWKGDYLQVRPIKEKNETAK